MKKLSLFSLHKPHNSKKTIIGKFLRQFLFTIIIPTILVWFLYLVVLNIYFIKNTLSIQQTYLENSLSQLTLSFSNADNIFSSLESIPEISYYLDVYSTKREMLYSCLLYTSFCLTGPAGFSFLWPPPPYSAVFFLFCPRRFPWL